MGWTIWLEYYPLQKQRIKIQSQQGWTDRLVESWVAYRWFLSHCSWMRRNTYWTYHYFEEPSWQAGPVEGRLGIEVAFELVVVVVVVELEVVLGLGLEVVLGLEVEQEVVVLGFGLEVVDLGLEVVDLGLEIEIGIEGEIGDILFDFHLLII